ncbi:hypothetical protein HR060_05180 [Catenovulum sp. SM1970]|uniref:hypothetical protein n=1 Tax=Marinifaba aquimaris TaxID=2741323 RepID=UPI0015736DA7|nr:hypothetical protein [Marinifaba aquimaris]NTS76255.1 hypothetical protein [Marinifaba aquimaris]
MANNREQTLNKLFENVSYGSSNSVIAHAGGSIKTTDSKFQSYTNSRQAIFNSINDGKKLIEIDLKTTSDGILIGAHTWKKLKKSLKITNDSTNASISYDDFKKYRLRSRFYPVDIFDLNVIFENHPDLILITDKTRDYKLLAKSFKFLNRVIVECFDLYECKKAQEANLKYVALNLKDFTRKDLKQYLTRNKIKTITFSSKLLEEKFAKNKAQDLIKAGFFSLVYTSNNDNYIRDNLGVTASAFYTDYWSLKNKSCIAKGEKCNTY